MQEKNKGYMGMYLSAAYFVVLLVAEFHPLLLKLNRFSDILPHVVKFISKTNFPSSGLVSRCILLGLLMGGIMLYRPKKNEKIAKGQTVIAFLISIGLLLLSSWQTRQTEYALWLGLVLVCLGYFGIMTYGMRLFQFMQFENLAKEDPFNERNETFIQNEELINTPHSASIPYVYNHEGKKRKGWINFVNLFRALLVIGTPGSGKSFSVIEEIMRQLIEKRFAMVIYDFKFNTLTKKAYGYLQKSKLDNESKNTPYPEMFFICFDDLRMTHRCNPMHQNLLENQSDAIDVAETLMKNLNPEWIKRQDYFSRSAISFTGACIWYLKKKADESNLDICTPGHLAVLSTIKVEILMQIMMQDSEVRQILVPFKEALEKKAMEQLAGQTSTVQISLSKLATKELFYVMSGNDFSLKINDPKNPKILSLQNNPERKQVYSAALGLYMNALLKKVNKPGKRPMALILDELPTLFIMLLRTIIDTGRENKIATVLGIQSFTQLVLDYGKDMAEVIYDNCANIICGAAKGETAKRLNELFGKIHQQQISKNANSNDVGTNISTQMMDLLPRSKIATMSTGHFAGIVADTFEHQIKQKKCFGQLEPNIKAKKEALGFQIPEIRDFLPDNFEAESEALCEQLVRLFHLDFIARAGKKLGWDEDWKDVEFYTLVQEIYPDYRRKEQACGLAKRMNLKSYCNELNEIMTSESPQSALKVFYQSLVKKHLQRIEIDRVAQTTFETIIGEVETLVKNEYTLITGKIIKNVIFDEEKINDELSTVMTNSDRIAEQFLDDYKTSMENSDSESLHNLQNDSEEFYSSFPIENYE